MAGHGGARPGAGRPEGGISRSKRLLIRGLTRGLALAAQQKGLEGSEDELAVQAVAMIASDLIQAGQGRDVLAILATAAPKTDDGPEAGGKETPLTRALRRLPGLRVVPGQSQTPAAAAECAEDFGHSRHGPTDPASVAPRLPYFAPQVPLVLDVERAPPCAEREPAAAPPAGAPAARAAGRAHPPPPGAETPGPVRPRTENFEIFSTAPSGETVVGVEHEEAE